MSDFLEFICPQCSVQVNVPNDQAGLQIDCPRCSSKITVPGIKSSADDLFSDIFDEKQEFDEPNSNASETTGAGIPDSNPYQDHEVLPFEDEVEAADSPGLEIDSPSLEIDSPGLEMAASNESSGAGDSPAIPTPDSLAPSGESVSDNSIEPSSPVDLSEFDLSSIPTDPQPGEFDELIPLDEPIQPPTSPLGEAPKHADPFSTQQEPKIRIDGVEGDYGSDMISVICPVCESRVYAQRSRAGAQVKCEDCFSMVDIPKEEEWDGKNNELESAKQTPQEMTFQVEDRDSDGTDQSLKPKIDYNVNEEYGLAPLDQDLLSPYQPLPNAPDLSPLTGPEPTGPNDQPLSNQPVSNQPLANPTDSVAQQTDHPVHPIETELFHRTTDTPLTAAPVEHENLPDQPPVEANPSPDSEPMAADPVQPGAGGPNEPADDGYDLLPLDDDDPPQGPGNAANPLVSPTHSADSPMIRPLDEKSTSANPRASSSPLEQGDSSTPTSPGADLLAPLPQSTPDTEPEVKGNKLPVHNESETNDSSDKSESPEKDAMDVSQELQGWVKSFKVTFQNLDGLLVVCVFAGFLAVGLGLASLGRSFAESETPAIVLASYFPWALGVFMWFVAFVFEGIIIYNAMLSGLYQKKEAAEWPEFNLTEMFSQLLNVGFANIISCIPGFFLWSALSLAGLDYAGPFFFFATRLLIGPPLMMSALKNQEFYKIYSPKVMSTYGAAMQHWFIFYGLLAIIGVFMIIFRTIELFNLTCIASAVYGCCHAFFLLAYGTMIGFHFGKVMRKIGETKMIDEPAG